jgi:hypothetical protein
MVKQLKIGPFTFSMKKEHLDGLVGECRLELNEIAIRPNLHPSVELETLIHEALHAIFHLNGLAQQWGEQVEEQVILRSSPLIFAFMRDNPKFLDAIKESQ